MKKALNFMGLSLFLGIFLHSCLSLLTVDVSKLLTENTWYYNGVRITGAPDTKLEDDINKLFDAMEKKDEYIRFDPNGTYIEHQINLGIAEDAKGNWSYTPSSKLLIIEKDSFIVVSINEEMMELQLSSYGVNALLGQASTYYPGYTNIGVIFIYKAIANDETQTGKLVDPRDGHEYKTVKIGNQEWMAENLAYLPDVVPPTSNYGSDIHQRFYVYGYNGEYINEAKATANYKTYGVLYNWPAAVNVCPAGWRLPNLIDWEVLQDQFGGVSVAGGKMKEKGTSHWKTPNTNGSNTVGFTALPGGFRNHLGSFATLNEVAYWWTSEYSDELKAWRRDVSYNQYDLALHAYHKEHGYSVRCIRDSIYGAYTDERDWKTYKTIKIGNQVWMAENLAYLPQVFSPEVAQASSDKARYYVYNHNTNDLDKAKLSYNYYTYGALYNWPAALNACPSGWRLPSLNDWETLQEALGGVSVAGGKMKEKGTSHWKKPNTNGSDAVGFTALPGGFRNHLGTFATLTEVGYWWSLNGSDATKAWRRDISYNQYDLALHAYQKEHGYSIRCIQDDSESGTFTDQRDGRTYKTVKIGNQVWLAENFAYLPYVNDPNDNSATAPRIYVYNNTSTSVATAKNSQYYNKYGALYNWSAAVSIAPAGWHLPTDESYTILENYLGGREAAGGKLKESGTAHWKAPNTGANNESGFTALPGGLYHYINFGYAGEMGFYWSSTQEGSAQAWRRDFEYDTSASNRRYYGKEHAYSVRLIKD